VLFAKLKLHVVATVGGRGFGLQAEVFRFRAIWLESRAAWRPPPHPSTEVSFLYYPAHPEAGPS